MSRFEDIDWDRLWKRLVIAASFAAAGAPDVFDGVSIPDLASETLAQFMAPPGLLGWKPSKGSLDKYLVGVLKKKALERLRRERYTAGSFDDPKAALPVPTKADDAQSDVEFRSIRDRLLQLVSSDQELRDLITAAELTTGAHNVNQELAEVLDRTPQEVVNLKRRLLGVHGVRELIYGQRRAKPEPRQ